MATTPQKAHEEAPEKPRAHGRLEELRDRVSAYRVMREELERAVLPLASSLDGLTFQFQASLHDLPLTVVHASSDGESAGLALAEATAGMAEKYPDVRATTMLTREPPHDLLVRLAERMNLVVVGAHQVTGLERVRTASVSVAVVEHASCPVAVVPVGSRRS